MMKKNELWTILGLPRPTSVIVLVYKGQRPRMVDIGPLK